MGDLILTVHNASVLRSLKPGDLVEFQRGLYSHWAVFIEDGEVVHLACEEEARSNASVTSSASSFSIGGALFDKAKVCRDNFWKVAAGCMARKNNTKDENLRPLSPAEIVEKAKSKLGNIGYNLLFSNCEHFAKWCRYGIPQSGQVEQAMTFSVRTAVGLLFAVIILLLIAVARYFINDANEQKEKQKVATKKDESNLWIFKLPLV